MIYDPIPKCCQSGPEKSRFMPQGTSSQVNYLFPKSKILYLFSNQSATVPRIGRTGRVGNTGAATSFFDRAKDGGLARPLLDILAEAQQVLMDLKDSDIHLI